MQDINQNFNKNIYDNGNLINNRNQFDSKNHKHKFKSFENLKNNNKTLNTLINEVNKEIKTNYISLFFNKSQ